MTRQKANPALVSAVVLATFFSGCGNGGNSNTSVSGNNPFIDAVASPSTGTAPISIYNTPSCLATLPLNSTITIKFNRPVDPNSLPNFATGFAGPAEGSIRIIDSLGVPANGIFAVDDDPDPLLPAGNNRWVSFGPTPPSNPNAACQAGLLAAQVYTLTIPQGPANPVLVVGGAPLEFAVTACFSTCTCTNGVSSPPCGAFAFTDPVPGGPTVVPGGVFPAAANTAPGPVVNPLTISDNTVRILVSEPLNPAGISPGTIVVKNAATGAPLPGTVVFFQTGSFVPAQAPPTAVLDTSKHSLIEYRASAPLLRGVTYQVSFPGGVTDFGGNPLPSGAQIFFSTVPATPCAQPPFVEQYLPTSTNIASLTGAIQLQTGPGNVGIAQTTSPIEIVGDGSDGALTVTGTTPTQLDTNQTIIVGGNPVSRQGKWNFTSFTVNASATARFHGIYPVHVRSLGTITINGTAHANAGLVNPALPGANPPQEFGPRAGGNDNGGIAGPATVPGGKGNGGGGDGGSASGNDEAASPSNYCPPRVGLRTYFGQNGFGPSIGGTLNTSTSNGFYAGGGGGRGGFFPNGLPNELGGFGGAGGTAATAGDDGLPRVTSTCAPVADTSLPQCPNPPGPITGAKARPVTAFFIPPINVQSAGSGGGGGGEKLDNIPGGPTPPAGDEQGGGGGGSGGGLRFSAVGAISMGTTGSIQANGATGAAGAILSGHGGSGSGGQIWLQSFNTITIPVGIPLTATGPLRLGAAAPVNTSQSCGNQAAGSGGHGLVQIEAAVGTPNSNFNSGGAIVQTAPFPFASQVVGEVLTNFFDAGYGNPDYGIPTEIKTLGDAPGAVLDITYEGAYESISGGSPDLTTLKTTIGGVSGGPKIKVGNVATELDGYRYVRVRINVAYPPPPTTPLTAILPSVDSVSIPYMNDCP